ncbi:cytochrome P460 family protein [bacterium]|nr:cytochrome P460 family protein [bacterium]
MKVRIVSAIALCFLASLAVLVHNEKSHAGPQNGQTPPQPPKPFNSTGPRYTADGDLLRPQGWRKWVYVGTPLTPHDMNDGAAAFPEFHNVYVDPESFSAFERTGEFPNGTQLVKELVLVGSKAAVSGNGYFMGDFAGLEVAVKDTVRFKSEPGGWAYFSFGHVAEDKYAPKATMFPTDKCNSCHQASADTDYVFTQYYPILRAAMPSAKMKAAAEQRNAMKKMDSSSMKAAMGAVGASSADAKPDDYSNRVFAWLQKKSYASYKAERAVHPSSSGAAVHGDVRVFVNDKLDKSMAAKNASHPIGSAAVKELYKGGKAIGWAAMIKSKSDDGKGNGWYWYEILSTTDSSKPVAASLGNNMCVGCHSVGTDFVRTRQIK